MKKQTKLHVISTYLFLVMSYIEDSIPYGQAFTFLTLLLMLFSVTYGHGVKLRIPKSGFITYMAMMLLFCCASMLWAESPSRTFIVVRGMLMTLILITIAFSCNYQSTSIDDFLKIIMYTGYTVVIYSVIRYGWGTLMNAFADELRISYDVINANTLGMCAAYSIVINFYYIIYDRVKLRDLLAIPAIAIIAASGSRKSIIIVIAGILLITIMKNYKKEGFFSNLFKGVFGVVIVLAIFYGLSRLSIFSIVIERFMMLVNRRHNYGGIIASDIRELYNIIGWNLFKAHPVLGIGIHNASIYISQYRGHPHLHNNFIELLACGGIIGFLIHYSFYLFLFYSFWKQRKKRTKEFDICLILLVVRFVMGWGHIQYFQATNYFFLMVIYLFIYRLKAND